MHSHWEFPLLPLRPPRCDPILPADMPIRPRNNIYGTTSVDRYLGLMFLGLAVMAFILLSVLGMQRVEHAAQQATEVDSRPGVFPEAVSSRTE